MNPLSPLTYYVRHKRSALLQMALICLATVGLFVLVGVLDAIPQRANVSYLTQFSRVLPTGDTLDPVIIFELQLSLREGQQIGEDMILRPVIVEIGIRERVADKVRIDADRIDQHEPPRIFDRQRPDEQFVHHAENSCIRPNTQRQSENGYQSEAGILQ